MPEKNRETRSLSNDTPSEPAPGNQVDAPSPDNSLQLNFHSPEFNTIDDLDDNTENYRSFGSLDGIVTSDMRYHEERKKKKSQQHRTTEDTSGVKEQKPITYDEENIEKPRHLTLTSRGRTLIISANGETAIDCTKILTQKGLTCTICVTEPGKSHPQPSRNGSSSLIKADAISVTGSFCGFKATALNNGCKTSLSSLLGKENDLFDLVLDLQKTPSYSGDQLPIGYYAPGDNSDLFNNALAELPEMKGQFIKPQFTTLRLDQCIHGRSKNHNCTGCLDICPAGAIGLEKKQITIDPYLCQGCGGCALVCPTDAIRLELQNSLLEDICMNLSETVTHAAHPPSLVIFDRNIDIDNVRCDNESSIFFGVEEITLTGLHILLTALAKGAGSVTVLCDKKRPAEIIQALKQQVELGRTILQEIGIPDDLLRFIIYQDAQLTEYSVTPENGRSEDSTISIPIADFSLEHDKRTLIYKAMHHICEAVDFQEAFINLPETAPFGTVHIDNTTCTLCMACISTCPTGSLISSGNLPRISMIESRCHQCGACTAACPEDAIRQGHRLLCNYEAAEHSRVLHEVEPFKCVECGEPFASQAMVGRMQDKLRNHWMYGNERQLRRLKMCRTCRTRDALMAGDYR